jgi:CBS domain-containing protein
MTDSSAQESSSRLRQAPATVADIMRPPLTSTVQQNDHVAAAAYLMKHADASALVVMDSQTDKPIGIVTEADIAHAVADRRDLNEVRIRELMTTGPATVGPDTDIREAARAMTSGRFRHLPVVGEAGVIGMIDITDVCRALLDLSAP